MATAARVGVPRWLRSLGAVGAGFLVVVALSLGTDQVLHVLNVYPPWGEPMYAPGVNLLALAYRCVYGVLGSYVTARLAPFAPMAHLWTGGGIGFVLSTVGGIAAMTKCDLGPDWYPISLALSALPTTWLGGVAYRRWQANHTSTGVAR